MLLEPDATYTYTANDQRLTEAVSQEKADTQAIDQRNWTFGYDTQDQLTSVTADGTTLYSYNYDGVGNGTDAGSFNSLNQYGGFLYNGQGDVINDGQFSYTWDTKGRLTSATPDSPDAQSQKDVFTYDPENRRTQEDIYSWDTNTQAWVYASSLKFVYDGSQMVAELNGQNQLLQTYTWGPTGTLLSISDYSGSSVKNYQVVTDGSGNVVQLLDSSTGLVAASYQYDPWGNPLSATGPAANVSPFRWQGEFYDASFGGYYMGAREDSARLHIFLSPDPSGEASDDNLYRDVGNDPINKGDSTGLAAESLISISLSEQAKADQQFDLAHGGWLTLAGFQSPATLQLNLLNNNPQLSGWMDVTGSGDAYLSGQAATPLPTTQDVATWQRNLALGSDISIANGMVGWHQDMGLGERMIPVWGNAKQALANFGRGDIIEGLANSYLAVTDLLLVGTLAKAGAKLTAGLTSSAIIDAADASAGSSRLLTSTELLATGGWRKGMAIIPFGKSAATNEGALYDVGLAMDLRETPVPYTQVHHVGQSAQAESLLGDFNTVNKIGHEPSIRITESEHLAINADQVNYPTPASARDLLARDILLLRYNTKAPNSALQQLIELNKTSTQFRPWDFNVKGN